MYSNFNYCPLVWHFSSAKSLHKVERTQECALRFQYDDHYSSYQEPMRSFLIAHSLAFKMSEIHFEDPDLKSSTLEVGFPSYAIEKDNFIDSQGKQICTENKEPF